MPQLPYVIISTAMTIDGYIDDASDERLVISNKKDLEAVNEIRKSCDGILIGANTIRKDNPRLLTKSEKSLTKITITASGEIDRSSNFFTAGDSPKIVYTISGIQKSLAIKLSGKAVVVEAGNKTVDLQVVLEDLFKRGINRLMVEGGSTILTQFFEQRYVNELRVAIAGFFVGDANAPRFVKPGMFPWNKNHKMQLVHIDKLDDMAILTYKL
jgi:5-amino-6-(5-phosphoribosylamino)uracil reductase